MKRLTIIGRVATPAAMVVFMTYEISRSMAVTGGWLVAIVIGAALTAVGIEVVGILSGHALETSWRVGDQWRALLALALLLIYTVGAVYILRRNDTIMPVPIIAAIVYVVAALVDGLERQVAQEETAVSQRESVDLEQLRLDRELEREIKRQQQADKTAIKLAQVQLEANQSQHRASIEQIKIAPERIECEDCGQSFGTVQALNAHGRWCKGKPVTAVYSNGKVLNGVNK